LFSADPNALGGALIQLLKGVGELVFDDGSDDPLSAHLEAVLGQSETSQLQRYSQEEKKSPLG
jgi:hypothetical protein